MVAVNVIRTHCGQPSYTMHTDRVDLRVTVQGGQLTADFDLGDRTIRPYFIAPWWREQVPEEIDEVIRLLRGDFFCFPFGANPEPVEGVRYPTHGETANRCWDFAGLKEEGGTKELRLSMDLQARPGHVEKIVRLSKGEAVVYQENRIRGFSGKTTVGYHPTLQFPPGLASGIVDMSEPLTGFVSPRPAGNPAEKGYSILKPGVEIHDRTSVPCTDGSTADLRRCPIRNGFVDIVLFASDPEREFAYSAATFPQQGYIYFQIKDPRLLRATMLWMSHGGRYSEPWNGRVRGALGLEEITGFFHYGLKAGVETNLLQERGIPTAVDLHSERELSVKLIAGVAAAGEGFRRGVKNVVRKDDRTVRIISRDDEEIEVPCRLGFLFD
jgi:hypothetical protein